MKPTKVLLGLVVLAVLAWLGFKLFPSDEKQIRSRLQELAETVSLQPSDGNIARALKSERLANFFAPEIVLQVELEPWEREVPPVTRAADLSEHYIMMTRSGINLLEVRIVDVLPKISPDGQTATVLASAIVRVNTQREPVAQELKMEWEKIQGRWLIKGLDAIRTLQ